MIYFITTIHIILCVVLMIVILLQAGKGAEIGAVFGGSSQTIFGSRGAATFLSKVTSVCAIGFMVTSLSLVYLNSRESGRSLFEGSTKSAPAATTTAPAAPAKAAAPVTAPAAQPAPSDAAKNAPVKNK